MRRLLTRVTLVGILALMTALVSACGADNAGTPGGTASAKFGDTLTIEQVAATYVSNSTLAPDPNNPLRAGTIFLAVHVKVTNNSSASVHLTGHDFRITRQTGGEINAEVAAPSTYTDGKFLREADVAAGATVEGDYIFEAPQADKTANLTWKPDFSTTGAQVAWALGIK